MLTFSETPLDVQDLVFEEVVEEAPAELELPFNLEDLHALAVGEVGRSEPEIPPNVAARIPALDQDEETPTKPPKKAVSRLRSRSGRNAVKRELAAIVQTFDDPYVQGSTERFFVPTDEEATGEIISLGRPLKGSQIFPSNALRRNIEIYNDFMAFAKGKDTSNWCFWNVGIPNRKSPVDKLDIEIKRFNDVLNIAITEVRKPKYVEVLLLGIHVRYDHSTGLFDLHAHIICDVPKETRSIASSKFFKKFSKTQTNDWKIRNLEAAVTYLLWGIIEADKLVACPVEAVKAVWDITMARARLMRTGGRFAEWRQARVAERRDPEAQAAKRRKAQNRAETAYVGKWIPEGFRVMTKLTLPMEDGRQRTGVLIEKATVRKPTAPRKGTTYPSATVAVTQESPFTEAKTWPCLRSPFAYCRAPQAWWWRAWPYGRPSSTAASDHLSGLPRPLRQRMAACPPGSRHRPRGWHFPSRTRSNSSAT